MDDNQLITVQPETQVATLTVHTDHGTIEAEPVTVRPGQAAQPFVTMNSETGEIGEVKIDVFDIA